MGGDLPKSSYIANLRVTQAVLDKLEREATPIEASYIRATLSDVEAELENTKEAEA